MKKSGCSILALFLSLIHSYSQSGSIVFNDIVMHEIKIQFPYSTWFDSLEADFELNLNDPEDSIPEKEFLCNMVFDGITLDSIGMRERGNFSNFSAPLTNSNGLKKPFKLDFNAYRKQNFDGLKELNLNNGTDDPGFNREALVYKLIRELGIPASRTSYAKLYVNDVYWGLYELVENVDKTFLKDHFGAGNNDGNLYKTDRNAGVDLTWLGMNPEDYEDQGLLLKTNDSLNDWSKFLNFVNIINHTQPGNMEKALSEVFDVESFMSILAVEVVCYSWDSYWGGGNNFYLYEHPDGKIRWIPWDFNETFTTKNGLLWLILPKQSDIFLSTRFDIRPLLKAIFSVRKWQDLYMEKLCSLCTNSYSSPLLAPQLIEWQNLVRPALAADANALGSMQSFESSLTTDVDNAYNIPGNNIGFNIEVPGLLPYITRQRKWVVDQINFQGGNCNLDVEPSEYEMNVYPNPATYEITISWDKITSNIYQLSIYNSMGIKIKSSGWIVNDAFKDNFTISELSDGFYILRKQDADGYWSDVKFLKCPNN